MLLYPIWLVLAAVFFTFAFQHWRLSQQPVRPFRMREGETANQALADFVRDWNQYLEAVNANRLNRDRVAMLGYAVAGALSIVAMFFTLPSP
jgi:hypothetical protein